MLSQFDFSRRNSLKQVSFFSGTYFCSCCEKQAVTRTLHCNSAEVEDPFRCTSSKIQCFFSLSLSLWAVWSRLCQTLDSLHRIQNIQRISSGNSAFFVLFRQRRKTIIINQDSTSRTVTVCFKCNRPLVLKVTNKNYFQAYLSLVFLLFKLFKTDPENRMDKDFNYLVDTKSAQKRHFQTGVPLFVFLPLPFAVVVPLQMEAE